MNRAKYGILNGDEIVGIVYWSEKYGRTITFVDTLDTNHKIEIMNFETGEVEKEVDFVEFLSSMIPV